ncbi:MAG TPA: RDD family protein [Lysobacter sp.]
MASPSSTPRPAALIGWRLLALLYDLWPVVALWMLASTVFTFAYTFSGHDSHQNIRPFSALQWLLWLVCWLIGAGYAVLSWRRGGQTLGMRPWRLQLIGNDGAAPGWRALMTRYTVGTASLLLAGLGFWWAWFDRDRLTWHDRASGTRMVRLPKQ